MLEPNKGPLKTYGSQQSKPGLASSPTPASFLLNFSHLSNGPLSISGRRSKPLVAVTWLPKSPVFSLFAVSFFYLKLKFTLWKLLSFWIFIGFSTINCIAIITENIEEQRKTFAFISDWKLQFVVTILFLTVCDVGDLRCDFVFYWNLLLWAPCSQ